MQCNQSFWGNGFANGPFYSNNAPLPRSAGMYPEVIGEGEVKSVTLPDGTIQFFFMPTVKWWAPNAGYPNMHNPLYTNIQNPMHTNMQNPTHTNMQNPMHTNMQNPLQTNMNNPLPTNMNYNNTPHWNNNVGTWFVRSISNPFSQQNTYTHPPSQRYEVPKQYYNSDCSMNMATNNGYQLKFHNDDWTSTTDLQYFYPNIRHREYMQKQPCKRWETVAVQVETAPVANNTICHYEVLCTKPCTCTALPKPMSLVSLVDNKSSTRSSSGSSPVECSCDDITKKRPMRDRRKLKRSKSKNVICDCESTPKILTAEKSITTYTDRSSSCTPADGRETQTCEQPPQSSRKPPLRSCCANPIPLFIANDVVHSRCEVKEPETWEPMTPQSKRVMEQESSENLVHKSDDEDIDHCSSYCSFCSS